MLNIPAKPAVSMETSHLMTGNKDQPGGGRGGRAEKGILTERDGEGTAESSWNKRRHLASEDSVMTSSWK